MNSKDLALTALFSALYAILVIVQGLSAAASIQVRLADALIPLAALFGPPVILGVSLGCVVCNAYLSLSIPFGFLDVIFGPIANLAAAGLIFKMRKKPLVGCVLGAVVIGLVVGSYLWLLFPFEDAILPPFLISIASITMSSLFALAVLGYGLLRAFKRSAVIKLLRSHGLKIYMENEK